MEDVLVWWRRKNKSGRISTFIQSISLSRGISYLGSIGSRHFISSFINKNAVNLHRKVLELFVIVGEYREQTWFRNDIVCIITLEVARCIKICTGTFYHISDGDDLATEKSKPFEGIASIVNLAIQVVLDEPRLDLTKRYSVDCANGHHFLPAIEANENFDAGLFFAVFTLESIVDGVNVVKRRKLNHIALGESERSVCFASLGKFFVADTLHTSKLCIWFRKINVYHSKIN